MEVLLKKRPAAPRGGGSSKAPEPLQLQLVVQWYQAVVVEVAPGVGGGDGVTWRDVRHTDRLCFGAAGEGEGGGAQPGGLIAACHPPLGGGGEARNAELLRDVADPGIVHGGAPRLLTRQHGGRGLGG